MTPQPKRNDHATQNSVGKSTLKSTKRMMEKCIGNRCIVRDMKSLVVAICSLGLVGFGNSQTCRQQLEQDNRRIHALMVKKDFKMMRTLMKRGVTTDFVYSENGQTQTIDQMMTNMEIGLSSMDTVSNATSRILNIKETGNQAVAKLEHLMTGTTKGPDKKLHTVTYGGTATETYVKLKGRWLLKKMVWGKTVMLMDGKPVNP
jgi:hypothetical protein